MGISKSVYRRVAGQSNQRPLTEAERAVKSLRQGADRAEAMVAEIKRLRKQVTEQAAWLDDPVNPTDDLWFQRQDIWNDRWTALYQDIGNLVGWVAIHLAEAERVPAGPIRDRVRHDVERLVAVERWIDAAGACDLRQHPNQEDPPF